MNLENKKQFATILLAVGLGLVAAMLMSKVVSDKVDQQTKVIAKEYQGRSTSLVKELDTTKKTLNRLAKDHAALAKRVAQQKVMVKKRPKAEAKQPAQEMIFSLRTPPGKRAVTILIKSLSAVGGLVNPGDFVDVIAHLRLPDARKDPDKKRKKEKEKVTTILFQNIQVLAVGTNFDPKGDISSYEARQKTKSLNVTLAVSPEEAGLLTFAQANGDFQLSLRSPAETRDKLLHQVASWEALADFVLEQQGTELEIRRKSEPSPEGQEEEEEEDPRPDIQIFRGGREL